MLSDAPDGKRDASNLSSYLPDLTPIVYDCRALAARGTKQDYSFGSSTATQLAPSKSYALINTFDYDHNIYNNTTFKP